MTMREQPRGDYLRGHKRFESRCSEGCIVFCGHVQVEAQGLAARVAANGKGMHGDTWSAEADNLIRDFLDFGEVLAVRLYG